MDVSIRAFSPERLLVDQERELMKLHLVTAMLLLSAIASLAQQTPAFATVPKLAYRLEPDFFERPDGCVGRGVGGCVAVSVVEPGG